MPMNVVVFPGQGSQFKGMGEDLFDAVTEFKAWESDIDQLLGYSVRQLCMENPKGALYQTQYTQPCLYTVNALHYLKRLEDTGDVPSIVVGHSLGEYNALWAAGAYDFLTGLRIVQKRGELMSQASGGGMAAVIGLEVEKIAAVINEHDLSDLDIANKNAPDEIIISGPTDSITRVGPLLEAAGASLYIPLPVSAAFHSRYMQPARDLFFEFLHDFEFQEMRKTVISNVTANPYPQGNMNKVISDLLARQITSPVEWTKTIIGLMNQGGVKFQEVGPGNVLTKLIDNISKTVSC